MVVFRVHDKALMMRWLFGLSGVGSVRVVREVRGMSDREPEKTYPHSSVSSSLFSIFLNLESLKALMRAYSAKPSCNGIASKLPMHPLRRGALPGREDRVFQVTNSGLID